MTEDERRAAYQLQERNRRAYQGFLDSRLRALSNAPLTQTRANQQPLRQFLEEGPDVGRREENDQPEGNQRIN